MQVDSQALQESPSEVAQQLYKRFTTQQPGSAGIKASANLGSEIKPYLDGG